MSENNPQQQSNKKFYQSWNFWQKILTLTFWFTFVFLIIYFYQNIEAIKNNPCSYCAIKYGLTCSSFERNLYIDENGTQQPLNKNLYQDNYSSYSDLQKTLSIYGSGLNGTNG